MINSISSIPLRRNSRCQQLSLSFSKGNRHIFLQQALAVSRGLYSSKMMRLLVPYQLCFGFSSGLVSTYINGVIVTTYIGDGYIGLLSSLVTLAAVISAGPFAYICNRYRTRGKWVIHFLPIVPVDDACLEIGPFNNILIHVERLLYIFIFFSYTTYYVGGDGVRRLLFSLCGVTAPCI